MTILDEILVQKLKLLDSLKEEIPVRKLEMSLHFKRDTISFRDYLGNASKTGIIAEFKRRSPSKGIINAGADVIQVTTGYAMYGASGLSVLTETDFFGGSADDLMSAREFNSIPIIRKDFILDEYQVIESKALGADAILLIAAALEKKQLKNLAELARSLELQVLLEVHDEIELGYINEFVDMVGVNNRNLKTFEVDTEVSVRLVTGIPAQFLRISESGISSASTVRRLKEAGYNGFLVGENFMKTSDPVLALRDFVKEIESGND